MMLRYVMRFQTAWSRRWFSQLDLWLAQGTVPFSIYKILHLMQPSHIVLWYRYFQLWWVWQDYKRHSYGKGVMAFGVQLQSMLQVPCLAANFHADPSQPSSFLSCCHLPCWCVLVDRCPTCRDSKYTNVSSCKGSVLMVTDHFSAEVQCEYTYTVHFHCARKSSFLDIMWARGASSEFGLVHTVGSNCLFE